MGSLKKAWMVGLAVAVLLCLPGFVHAGFYFESEQVTVGVPGQPPGNKLIKTYLMDNFSRTDRGDAISIMDYQTMISYELNPLSKTYTKHDMTKLRGMGEMEGASAEQMQRIAKQMADSMKIVPTDETMTVAGYDCRKYDVQFMMATGVYWVTQDIKGYKKLRTLTLNMAKAFEQNPMMKQMNVMAMMDQMEGFPIKTIMNVMGGQITTTVKTIQEKPLDKSLFEVPKGYTLVENR